MSTCQYDSFLIASTSSVRTFITAKGLQFLEGAASRISLRLHISVGLLRGDNFHRIKNANTRFSSTPGVFVFLLWRRRHYLLACLDALDCLDWSRSSLPLTSLYTHSLGARRAGAERDEQGNLQASVSLFSTVFNTGIWNQRHWARSKSQSDISESAAKPAEPKLNVIITASAVALAEQELGFDLDNDMFSTSLSSLYQFSLDFLSLFTRYVKLGSSGHEDEEHPRN
ncbi:hypothetical protein CSUB01_11189 [Colletotrichum sublineola]|uniref:Uncharacterized protein n=1 Tax=Colletotrichum sublineola TaxID=1173701 RepID=A0A066XJ30_COLSU|nr:hypothetical protein CSUB01_11189 [Colletotrichum sublineola]